MGVMRVYPIVRIEIVRKGFMYYKLVGYDKMELQWSYMSNYFTAWGAKHAARRTLAKEDNDVVGEVRK